jgi:NADPH:quinone reductase
MHRVMVSRIGGPEQLVFREAPDLVPGPGDLLVELGAAGVNYVDVYQRTGVNSLPLPYTPGHEGVGTVLTVGAGVTAHKSGDRVAWINILGSYAEQVIVPAGQAIAIPSEFTTEQCLLFQAVTAQYLVSEYRAIRAGDTALVHAAAGGVGHLLVQWLKHLGAYVVATASSPEKLETVRSFGADAIINYANGSFLDEVMQFTQGRGVDIAFDAVGKATLLATVAALAPRGTAVSYGLTSGVPPAIEPLTLIQKSARLAGGSIFVYSADTAELQTRCLAVLKAIQDGWLKLGGGHQYTLSEAAMAHRDIESRQTQGKLYLTR